MLEADAIKLRKALAQSDLSGSARAILRELILRSTQAKECSVSIDALARQCGYCERTVQNKMKELIRKGWIVRRDQYASDGSRLEDMYIILMPEDKKQAANTSALLNETRDYETQTTKYDDVDVEELKLKIETADLPKSSKDILTALAGYVNKDNECYPAVSALKAECGYSERIIRKRLKELAAKGWVVKIKRYRANGAQTSNLYRIKIPY